MSKITLYTLAECRNCNSLKLALKDQEIQYTEIQCNDPKNDYPCDSVEKLLDCRLYPIVKIAKKAQKDVGGYYIYKDDFFIIHYCNLRGENLLKRKLDDSHNTVCVDNIYDMIDLIIKNK